MIDRRVALERISLMLGGALSPQMTAAVMGQTLNAGEKLDVSDAQKTLLAEVADVIIPTTDTPGAKAAGVEEFIVRVIRDCYVIEDQQNFYEGLARIDTASQKAHETNFVDLDSEQKIGIVEETVKNDRDFFKWMKELTVVGYFTSEIGATEALVYLPIPGKFEGDLPMQPGQKAWAISR